MSIFLDLLCRQAPAAPSVELPDEVLAALESAHILMRPHGEDGAPRAVVQLPGSRGGWLHDESEDKRHIARLFPDLNATQLDRAHRYLAAQVRRRVRALAAGSEATGPRRSFANSWGSASW